MSLILRLTHNRHAPARDNNNPTLPSRTERPRSLTHQLSLDMRRNEPLWLILAWSSSLRSTVTDRARWILRAWHRPTSSHDLLCRWKVAFCYSVNLVGSWRVALATPTTKKINVHHSISVPKLLDVGSVDWTTPLLLAIARIVGVASVTLTTEPFSHHKPFPRSVERVLLLIIHSKFVFKPAEYNVG